MNGNDIDQTVRGVLEDEPAAVRDHLEGEDGALNYLVGKVMAAAGGQLDPGEAQEAIDRILEEDAPEWPVTFSIYSRPTDKTAIAERLWNHVPRWVDGPHTVDGNIPEFEFEVTVEKDGSFTLEAADGD